MNTAHILAAHRAHIAAHGPDCGRGSGVRNDPCHAIYRTWLHLSTGEWRDTHPFEQSLRNRAWREANSDAVKTYSRAYAAGHRDEIRAYRKAHPTTTPRKPIPPEKHALYTRRWREKNRDHLRAYRKAYAAANPDYRRREYERRKAKLAVLTG